MNTKFEFTGEVKTQFGITLKRIKRIADGIVGGWIEKKTTFQYTATLGYPATLR